MSNGDLETRVTNLETSVSNLQTSVSNLEASISALQDTMDTLIANLAANNTSYLQALDVLAHDNESATKVDAVDTARAGICTSNPPGCHV